MRASLFLMMFLALTVSRGHAMTEKATSSSSVADGMAGGAQSQSECQIEKDNTIQALRQEKEVDKARIRALEQNRGSEHKADHMGEELKTGFGGVIPGTSSQISVTRSSLCDTYTNSGGTVFCHVKNEADSDCTQSSLTAAGYWDFTNYAADMVCGANSVWNGAISKYTHYTLVLRGHSADFSLKSRTTGWDGRDGDFMVISVTGKAKDSSVQCELEAGVKMMLCNSYTADWTCSCQINGQAGPLILLEQGAKLVSGTQEACGTWFVGASTAVTMLVGNMRSITLQLNPVTQRCLRGIGYGCAAGSTLEVRAPEGYHADVCRSDGPWTCPIGCEKTSDEAAPYCLWAGTSTSCHESTAPATLAGRVRAVVAVDAAAQGSTTGDSIRRRRRRRL